MWRRTWLVFSQAVTVAVAALFVVLTFKPEWLGGASRMAMLPRPTLIQAPLPDASASAPAPVPVPAQGLALAARRAAPAVVSVTATKPARRNPHADLPGFRVPNADGNPALRTQAGLGSAVIVSPEGYLLTNHHVVEGAIEIAVQLSDGRTAAATLVGSDPETDIAVLKIALVGLPVITLGDVRSVQVGDAVLAIGNPFNVGQTVTAGIVSALDRSRVSNSPLQNFIQTDAAINPGNSGGALVDAEGRLVGINTAIFSRNGQSMGIGFAVPADTARVVMEQLIASGSVRRGWIGVEPQNLSAELAESLNLPVKAGALITGVLQDGPAARGGLKPGDVVVRVGDKPVANTDDLLFAIAALAPDSTARLKVQRGAQVLDVSVKVSDRTTNLARAIQR